VTLVSPSRRLWQLAWVTKKRRNGEVCWWCAFVFPRLCFTAVDVEIPVRAVVAELANGQYSFEHGGVSGTFTRAQVAEVWTGDITADVLVFFAERVAAEAARVAANKRAADAEAAIQAARVAAEAEHVAAIQAERVAAFDGKLNTAANTTLNACKSFYNSKFPLGQSKSANSAATSSLSTKGGDERPIAATISSKTRTSVAELCGAGYVERGDRDDGELLGIMERWWADVRSGDGAYNPTKGAKKEFAVTAALVAKVLGSGEGDEVSEVQPVMCSLLATYFAAAWADTPWLHFFAERRTSDTPEATITSASKSSRYYDAAAVASSSKIATIDHVARASAVMSFEFKPRPARGGSAATTVRVLNEASGQSLQDAAVVLKAATPGATTPCLFAFAGTPVDFDLLRMLHDFSSNSLAVQRFKVTPTLPNADQLRRGRGKWTDAFAGSSREHAISLLKPIHQVMQHVVRHHALAAAPAASTTAEPWRMPTPLMIASSFALPPPFPATAAVLAGTFAAFDGAEAPTFAGDCTIKFEAVLAATDRRMVCRVQVGATERRLVLKFGSAVASIVRERDRVKRVCELLAGGALQAHRDHVRLPLGCINGEWPVLVSDVWPGRSLNVGCPSNNATRQKVRALLERQIWPVINALAAQGVYYVDLHAGNVMVDEALENAWLLDFEGAVEVAEVAGSPTRVAEKTEPTTAEQLSAAVAAQMADLLKRFEEI
jgi:hypothetical protein